MTVAYKHGTPLRRSGEGQGATMRVRAGALTRGEVTAVDHGAADALTTAAHPGGVAIGDAGVASSARATVRKVSALVTEAGTIGVSTMSAADDGTTKVELAADFGEQGVLVEAIVEANRACTAGALLVASSVGGYGCFRAASVEPSPVAFARLETAATTAPDGTFGTHASLVRRWVQLFPHGVATGLEQAGTVTNADLATDAPRRHMRAAAWSGKGSSSTAGGFAVIAWAPSADGSSNESFTLRFKAHCRVSHSSTVFIMGRGAPNYVNIVVTAADANGYGDIVVRNNGDAVLTVTDGYNYRGGVHSISCTITNTTATMTVNDVLAGSATFAAQAWSNVADTNYVGAGASSSSARWPGALWDVQFIDHNNANNCVFLTMDEPMTSTTYANAYLVTTDPLYNASTTAPATATKNTSTNGQAFPWTCSVISTDGRGMPWQSGSGGALVYSAHRDASGAGQTITADATLTFRTEEQDPTGSLDHSTGVFVSPSAGIVDVSVLGDLIGTTVLSSPDALFVYISNSTTSTSTAITASVASGGRTPVSHRRVMSVAAGEVLSCSLGSVSVGDTITFHGVLTFLFTPTPVAG